MIGVSDLDTDGGSHLLRGALPEAGQHVGVVVIGRNEGERLRACLASLRSVESGKCEVESHGTSALALSPSRPLVFLLVYVDSGSTDGSVALARAFGAAVVELDMGRPFSAARARNEGFARLRQISIDVEYVQFVDGDCVVVKGWIDAAAGFLSENMDYAAVAGRLRERFPHRSIYNRLCDMEWNTPVGDVDACGGIAMYRARAFEQVGGFDQTVVAGEEPELCLRLRQAGWKIRRLDTEMALHDAAMTHFGQWWKRSVRGGYGYALAAWMHGEPPERHCVRETRSIRFWGLLLPLVLLGLAWPTKGWSLLLLFGYMALAWRVYRHMRGRGFLAGDSRVYAFFCVLAKFPQAQGQLRFWRASVTARPSGIIEYKSRVAGPVAGDCG